MAASSSSSSPRSSVILSADLDTVEEIVNLIGKIGDRLAGVKLHSDCISDLTKDGIQRIRGVCDKYNLFIIEDRKFSDIGFIVMKQTKPSVEYADYITVHAIAGQGTIDGLRAVVRKKCRILLVAEMSSNENLIDKNYTDKVRDLARRNSDIVAGFISQNIIDDSFLHFTPGVSQACSGDSLGQRYNTPSSAYSKGVDYIIVGREIYLSSDPVLAVEKYMRRNCGLAKTFSECGIVERGDFTLKSGVKSSIYIDCRKLNLYPAVMKTVAQKLYSLPPFQKEGVEICVVGVPMGAIPLAATISTHYSIPLLLLRPFQKEHGTKKLIEGVKGGERCIVVEDVITTGSSVLEAIDAIEKEGVIVEGVVAIVDRGGMKNVAERGYLTYSLLTMDDLL